MEIRQLQYLMVIAEEANFTRAAERLFVSQSALSQQIQKLEQELDTLLLDRTGRRVRLTDAGTIVYRHAKSIFQELETVQTQIAELSGLERGLLKIGVIQSLNAYLIPTVVRRFKQSYPKLQLQVQELTMDEIEDALDLGDLHLGLGFQPVNRPGTESEGLFTERFVLILSSKHPLAKRKALSLAEIDTELLMLSRQFCSRRLWDSYAAEAGIQPQISIEMNTINAILQTLPETEMGTVLPEMVMAMDAARSLVAIPLLRPCPEREISLLWRLGAARSKAAEAFAKIVRDACQ
jgi:LysR family cyn operon transcriptional activator